MDTDSRTSCHSNATLIIQFQRNHVITQSYSIFLCLPEIAKPLEPTANVRQTIAVVVFRVIPTPSRKHASKPKPATRPTKKGYCTKFY